MPGSISPIAAAVLALSVHAAGDAVPQGARTVNLVAMSCEQFLAVPEADRAPIVWFLAGAYGVTGMKAKSFDLDRAAKALPAVHQLCRDHPDASLRYQVVDLFRAEDKAAKAQGKAAKKAAQGK
jgi:hypothetical protein